MKVIFVVHGQSNVGIKIFLKKQFSRMEIQRKILILSFHRNVIWFSHYNKLDYPRIDLSTELSRSKIVILSFLPNRSVAAIYTTYYSNTMYLILRELIIRSSVPQNLKRASTCFNVLQRFDTVEMVDALDSLYNEKMVNN